MILGVESRLLMFTRCDREAQLQALRFPEMYVSYVPPNPNKVKKRMPYIVTLPVKGGEIPKKLPLSKDNGGKRDCQVEGLSAVN